MHSSRLTSAALSPNGARESGASPDRQNPNVYRVPEAQIKPEPKLTNRESDRSLYTARTAQSRSETKQHEARSLGVNKRWTPQKCAELKWPRKLSESGRKSPNSNRMWAKAGPNRAQSIRHSTSTHKPAHNDSDRFWSKFGVLRRRSETF